MKSFYQFVVTTSIEALVNGIERLSNTLGGGSVLVRIREFVSRDDWARFLLLTFILTSVNPFLSLFQLSASLLLIINVFMMGAVICSSVLRNYPWFQTSVFRYLSLPHFKFVAGFLLIQTLSALTITRIGLLTEMILIGFFLAIALGQPKRGLHLFALTLPVLTYRPLLAFILILCLVLVVAKPDYQRVKENLKNQLNLAVLLFVIMLFVTAVTSVNWLESVTHFGLYFLVSFVLYLLVLVLVNDRETMEHFIWMLLISGTIISVYGCYQYLTLEFTSAKWIDISNNPGITKRIFATFGNPNIFAQYLIMILPLNLGLLLYSKLWRHRFILAGMFAISFVALLLTYSRGAWAAIAVGLVIVVTMISRRLLVLGIIAAAVGVQFLPASIITRIQSIANPTQDSSASYRFEMWKSGLAMIRDFWKTGIGSDASTFLKVYADYMMPQIRIFHFHNIYIMTMVTGGVLLFLALMYMLYQAIRTAYVGLCMKADGRSFHAFLFKAAIGSVIAIALAGMTEDIWRQYRVDFMFWVILAIISATYNFVRHDQSVNITKT